MENKKLKILLKKVGQEPVLQDVEDTLEAKQKLVGGLIEIVPFPKKSDVLIVCNEEGKLLNLLPNLTLGYDYIAGDCFFIKDDYNGGFESLTDEDIEQITKALKGKAIPYSQKELNNLQAEMNKYNETTSNNLIAFFNDYYKDITEPLNEDFFNNLDDIDI